MKGNRLCAIWFDSSTKTDFHWWRCRRSFQTLKQERLFKSTASSWNRDIRQTSHIGSILSISVESCHFLSNQVEIRPWRCFKPGLNCFPHNRLLCNKFWLSQELSRCNSKGSGQSSKRTARIYGHSERTSIQVGYLRTWNAQGMAIRAIDFSPWLKKIVGTCQDSALRN